MKKKLTIEITKEIVSKQVKKEIVISNKVIPIIITTLETKKYR